MLQIISGKFFDSDNRFTHSGKGILFTNYSWIQPIKTRIATLEPVDTYGSVSSYVVSYQNQIEKEKPPEKDILVRIGDAEIVDQFKVLCSFYFKAFFHLDRAAVATACRDKRINASDYCIPSQFVPRYFSRLLAGSMQETEDFALFIDQVIGLGRKDYEMTMIALHCFNDAMQIVGSNISLAYSLLVYSIEALAQRSDSFVPEWDDYPLSTRDKLNTIFEGVEVGICANIKSVLLKDSNLKSTVRFLEFVRRNIDDSFFTDESPSGFMTVRKSEFDHALKNAYAIRSKFAHLLQPIQEQLRHPQIADGDVVRFSGEPYFTVAGLFRVAQHVVRNFIKRSKKIEHEKYNWRTALPGLIQMEVAPQYWIWKHEGVKAEHSTQKLSGFLSQLDAALQKSEPLSDLRCLLDVFEKLARTAPSPHKEQMLATYFLYNCYVKPDGRSANYEQVIERYVSVFDNCTIESLLLMTLTRRDWPWATEQYIACWNNYSKVVYKKNSIRIPQSFYVAIILEIAALFLGQDNQTEYQKYMHSAMLESAGQAGLQKRVAHAASLGIAMRGMEIFTTQPNCATTSS